MKRPRMIWLLLLAVMVVGGCAKSSASSQGAVRTNQVQMAKSYRFDPPVISVKAGATVAWVNQDNFTHDVTLTGNIQWRSQPLRPSDRGTYTFTTPGEYAYYCGFHPRDMQGKVIVTAQ